MKRFFQKTHLWLSIPFGVVITIICLTGAILCFQTELQELINPDRYFVKEIKGERLPLAELIPMVNNQLDTNRVAGVKIPSDLSRTYVVSLEKGFRMTAFVDPYTGEVKAVNSFREGFFFKVMTIHRWLMDDSRTWGKSIVGVSTLVLVVILISGLVLWFPTSKAKLKNRFSIKAKNGSRRFFYDLHVSLGFYVSLIMLICALTGLMWSFEWYKNGVNRIFGVEKPESKDKKGSRPHKEESKTLDYTFWQLAYEDISKSLAGDYEYINIENGSAIVLTKQAVHARATDKYVVDETTGRIKKVVPYADQDLRIRIMLWGYVLHTGAFGGLLTRILYCAACLIGATLPLTGYYMYYRRIKKKKARANEKEDC